MDMRVAGGASTIGLLGKRKVVSLSWSSSIRTSGLKERMPTGRTKILSYVRGLPSGLISEAEPISLTSATRVQISRKRKAGRTSGQMERRQRPRLPSRVRGPPSLIRNRSPKEDDYRSRQFLSLPRRMDRLGREFRVCPSGGGPRCISSPEKEGADLAAVGSGYCHDSWLPVVHGVAPPRLSDSDRHDSSERRRRPRAQHPDDLTFCADRSDRMGRGYDRAAGRRGGKAEGEQATRGNGGEVSAFQSIAGTRHASPLSVGRKKT